MECKWIVIAVIALFTSLAIRDFAPSKTEEAKQKTLKMEIELKDKEIEILKLKGKEN